MCVLSKKIWFCVFMMKNHNEKQKTDASYFTSTSYFRLMRLYWIKSHTQMSEIQNENYRNENENMKIFS